LREFCAIELCMVEHGRPSEATSAATALLLSQQVTVRQLNFEPRLFSGLLSG